LAKWAGPISKSSKSVSIPFPGNPLYILNYHPQFGMYIMFPIAIMYYYGTNLDNRFSVPDFWPKAEQTNRIPFEKEEIRSELDRLRQKRLYLRERRLEREALLEQRRNDGGGSGA
jgi:protein PET100